MKTVTLRLAQQDRAYMDKAMSALNALSGVLAADPATAGRVHVIAGDELHFSTLMQTAQEAGIQATFESETYQ